MKKAGDKAMALMMTAINVVQVTIWSGCAIGFLVLLAALKDAGPVGYLSAGVGAGILLFIAYLRNLANVRLENDLRDTSVRSEDSSQSQ